METEAEKQLAKLVAMPTITDDIPANDMALDYIEAYLKKRGMHTKRDRFDGHGTLVASTRPDNAKKPSVLLHAHVDVMPGSDKVFTLRCEGDKLLGRGVYDMKFAIAGYLELVDDLRDQLDSYDFAIMITSDEEYGSRDGINGAKNLVAAGYLPGICITPDSTAPNWEVEKLAKGFWRFDLVAKGKTAHGSRPWEGESASFKLIQALHELKGHFKEHGMLTDILNIGKIHGGEAYNLVPSSMVAATEIRVMSKEATAKYKQLVADICEKHDVNFEERSTIEPIPTDLTDPLVVSFMDSIEKVTGKRPEGYVSGGQSDAPYFVWAGVQCILTCPEGGKHHSEDEWISRTSFLKFVPILKDYLEKTANIPSRAKTPARELTRSQIA